MIIDYPLPAYGWKPRDDQRPLWDFLENGGLRACEVAHRRWGKDDVALHFTAVAAHQRIGNYWHMLPEYAQARKVVWDAINPNSNKRRIDEVFPEQLRQVTRNQEMLIRFNYGSTWQLVGSDNFNSLVGSPPIGVVFSEYARANPLAWAYLSPILEENGGWAIFISTPCGNNHLKRTFDHSMTNSSWYGQLLTADDTPVFNAEQLANIRKELINQFGDTEGEGLFQQEYYCSFEGIVPGSYYAKQIREARREKRICGVPYISGLEVYTFWDLGMDDATTIWFMQLVGREFHFIDYYENSGEGLTHYAKVIKDKPYIYGDHYFPHDISVRELGSGISRKETAQSLGIKPIIAVKRPNNTDAVLTGIETVRNILSQCWFDGDKCAKGLSGLEGYMAEYDEENKKFMNRPKHNWCSHAADAFRTFAVGFELPQRHRSVTEMMDSIIQQGSW